MMISRICKRWIGLGVGEQIIYMSRHHRCLQYVEALAAEKRLRTGIYTAF